MLPTVLYSSLYLILSFYWSVFVVRPLEALFYQTIFVERYFITSSFCSVFIFRHGFAVGVKIVSTASREVVTIQMTRCHIETR